MYQPTVKNVLKFWRWVNGPETAQRVKIDWCTDYSQSEAKAFLLGCLHKRINAGAPVTGTRSEYPARQWRKLDQDYQVRLRRDAWKLAGRSAPLNPWHYFETPELSKRLPHIEARHKASFECR